MTRDSFGKRDYAVGEIIGQRFFKLDKYGRLRSPQQDTIIRPGVNIADCKVVSRPFRPGTHNGHEVEVTHNGVPVAQVIEEGSPPGIADPEYKYRNRAGALNCNCGFYSYFERGETFSGPIHAIIKGYGVCTVGDLGFRSEKMEIIAIVDPVKRSTRFHESVGKRINKLPAWLTLALFVVFGVGILAAIGFGIWLGWKVGLAILTVAAICGYLSWADALRENATTLTRENPFGNSSRVSQVPMSQRMDRFKELYPDIKVYRTYRAALAAHPLSAPFKDHISPEDREDFWERDELI